MPATAKSCSAPEFNAYELAECGPLPEAETKELGPAKCREKRNILILDDDKELLEAYKQILSGLPSRPKVRVANSATQALGMLDAEPFELFITDLRMPKIDGFQVLLSAQRRSPDLKTVVMTRDGSDQSRARAYESGIDLFIQKPTTAAEIRLFGEWVEALLLKEKKDRGFRGIQRKSLMDLVQFECLSQNSSTLRITSGPLVGRVWILNGNVIDAEANGMRGEDAFRYIFGWKTGNFENDAGRPRA